LAESSAILWKNCDKKGNAMHISLPFKAFFDWLIGTFSARRFVKKTLANEFER
jgi:hypothetical protein